MRRQSSLRTSMGVGVSAVLGGLLLGGAWTLAGCADAADAVGGCAFHTECPEGKACLSGVCRPGCRGDEDCPGTQVCTTTGACFGDADGGVADGDGALPDLSGPCLPNADGVLQRAEFRLAPGAGAAFVRLTPDDPTEPLAVELEGQGPAGGLTWDLTEAAGHAERVFARLLNPAELGAGELFPLADYAVELPGSGGQIAFFELGVSELRLLGLADAAAVVTRLVYDPPVVALRFPLRAGDRWATATVARGTFLGAEVTFEERYSSEVRASGVAQLPAGELPVLQVVTDLEREVGAASLVQRQSSVDFLAECGGYVARAASYQGQQGLFTEASSLELLLPQACRLDGDCGAAGRCGDEGFCAPSPWDVGDPLCVPNGDGIVQAAEHPTDPGLYGVVQRNASGRSVTVDLRGVVEGDGRLWDLRGPELGDELASEQLQAPDSFWFAPRFPGATYVAVLDAATGTLAVFRREAEQVLMLGIASEQPGRTALVYETPVPSMRFPLAVGDGWSATTVAAGLVDGAEMQLDMTYTMTVDVGGRVLVPAGEVPVLRVQVASTQQIQGAPWAMARQTTLLVAECLGAVARVVSEVNETEPEFSIATDVTRATVPRCFGDAQCRAGHPCELGRCAGEEPIDPPDPDGGVPDGGGGLDAGVEPDGGALDGGDEPEPDAGSEEDGGGPPLCNPLGDGVVDRDEFPLRAGVAAHLAVASSEVGLPVDLHGSECDAGRCWDFAGPRAGDHVEVTELLDVRGAWFEEDFPEASYASLLDAEQGWLGVFQLTDDELLLLGTASAEPNRMRTTYDPPVALYRFPLRLGDEWTVQATQQGYMGWTPIYTEDEYRISVPAQGTLDTPLGSFRVLQVVAETEQSVPLTIFHEAHVLHTFLSECFGIVARVSSLDDEDEAFFERAARIERLAPAE